MQNAPLQRQDADDSTALVPIATDGDFLSPTEFRIRFFLIAGVVLVCFAETIVGFFVLKQDYGPNLRDNIIHNFAPIVRLLGMMAFAAGLVDRIVLAISRIKS